MESVKLFRVEVTKVAYVLAKDEREAENNGEGYAGGEAAEMVTADEITVFAEVEGDWKDAIPYGGKDDKTIRQWFEKPEDPKPYVDPPEQQWFGFA